MWSGNPPFWVSLGVASERKTPATIWGAFEESGYVWCFPDFLSSWGLKLQKKTHRLRILQRHGFFHPKNLDPKAAYAAACSHVVTPSAWKYLGVPGPWSIRQLLPLNADTTWGAMVSIHFSIHLNDKSEIFLCSLLANYGKIDFWDKLRFYCSNLWILPTSKIILRYFSVQISSHFSPLCQCPLARLARRAWIHIGLGAGSFLAFRIDFWDESDL